MKALGIFQPLKKHNKDNNVIAQDNFMKLSKLSDKGDECQIVIDLKPIEPVKRGLWKTLNYESHTVHHLIDSDPSS